MASEDEEDSFTFTLFTDCKNNYIEARNTVDKNLGMVLQQRETEEEVKPLSDVQHFSNVSCDATVDHLTDSCTNEGVLDDVSLNARMNLISAKKHSKRSDRNKSPRGQGHRAARGHSERRGGTRRSSRVVNRIPRQSASEKIVINDTIFIEDSDGEDESSQSASRQSASERIVINDTIFIEHSDGEDESSVLLDFSLPFEVENSEVSIKVWWKFQTLYKFQIRKFQKLSSVYKELSEKENVPEEQIVLLHGDEIISPNDTPDSLKLTVADILEGGISHQQEVAPNVQSTNLDKKKLEFKLIFKDQKKPLLVAIEKENKMKILMIKCAEQMEIPIENLKFTFDGEELDSGATPVDLDLEGGECIEVAIKK